MPHDRRDASFWKGLSAGLASLVVVMGVVLLSDRSPSILPTANAQFPAVAGGGGVYLMPGQLATNAWGVYLLDTDRGTLVVYRYDAGNDRLNLLAARDINADRGLSGFNTFPPPAEIQRLVEVERDLQEGRDRQGGIAP